MSDEEPSYGAQLQSQTLNTVFSALGGLMMMGNDGTPAVVMDNTATVRRTLRHREADTSYVYTTTVTVRVSRTPRESR